MRLSKTFIIPSQMFKLLKAKLIKYLFTSLVDSTESPLIKVGDPDSWFICPTNLNSNSNVLSAGAGMHITFELNLIKLFNCTVNLYDPSPTGKKTASQYSNNFTKLSFFPIGLAASDGFVGFGVPDNPDEGSWKSGCLNSDVYFECQSLSTIMAINNWKHIDLLKIDIEGFEYQVIDDIIKNNLNVSQICVEFHSKGSMNIDKTGYDLLWNVFRLKRHGYSLIHLTKTDFTFIKKQFS